jgi:hypothetical protein
MFCHFVLSVREEDHVGTKGKRREKKKRVKRIGKNIKMLNLEILGEKNKR